MTKHIPEAWQPLYPAYASEVTGSLHVCMIAAQAKNKDAAILAYNKICSLLVNAKGLMHSEHVFYIDEQGYSNEIEIAYWEDQGYYKQWIANSEKVFLDITSNKKSNATGIWIEAMSCGRERFEISCSMKQIDWGLACHHATYEDRMHGYYGAMRDRIAAAENGGLPGSVGRLSPKLDSKTLGEHLTVSLPDNLCFIRTVQGWNECGEEERNYFLANTFPVYRRGVEFLQLHPIDTNCISARLVNYINGSEHSPQTETLAWFLSLSDLEAWAWNHPTHLAILNSRQKHMKKYLTTKLLLGHEVSVISQKNMHVEYHNCHNETGFLKFFHPVELL